MAAPDTTLLLLLASAGRRGRVLPARPHPTPASVRRPRVAVHAVLVLRVRRAGVFVPLPTPPRAVFFHRVPAPARSRRGARARVSTPQLVHPILLRTPTFSPPPSRHRLAARQRSPRLRVLLRPLHTADGAALERARPLPDGLPRRVSCPDWA